jgi:hypothetical protein
MGTILVKALQIWNKNKIFTGNQLCKSWNIMKDKDEQW